MQRGSDVLIVGAGPVGMLTALLLQSMDCQVQIVERRPARWNLPRAVTCYSQILRILQALGVLEEFLEAKAVYSFRPDMRDYAEWMGADGQLVVRIPFNGDMSRSGMHVVYGMNQMVFDHMLDKVCADRGLPILRGREVVGIEDKGTHVELMWKRHMPKEHRMGVDKAAMDEEVHRMSALFVVGCDGAHSRVRESAGIKFIPQAKGQQHRWLVLDVQAKPGTDSSHLKWKDAGIFRQYNTPSRPCTSAPSPAFRRRIEFMILPHEPSSLAQDDDFVWSLLKPWGCNPDNATLARRTIFSPQGGWAECFSRGRVVLAGDAAHNSPQFLGAGANTGLRDAKSLAWRLQLAVKHPEIDYELLLHDYSVEQHGIAAKLVTMALDIERLIAVTDPELARNRDTELMQAPIVEGYPDVEALGPPGMYLRDEEEVKRGHDTGGHLFIHDDVVYHGKRGPFDVVVGQGWLLLGSGPEAPAAMLEPRTRDQYRTKLSGSFVHCGRDAGFEDVSGRYTGWFRNNEAYAVLVRPDFYIYGVAKTRADVQRIVRTALDHISSVA